MVTYVNAPTDVRTSTLTTSQKVSAKVTNPKGSLNCIVAMVYSDPGRTVQVTRADGTWVKSGSVSTATITGLKPDTTYYVHLWGKEKATGHWSPSSFLYEIHTDKVATPGSEIPPPTEARINGIDLDNETTTQIKGDASISAQTPNSTKWKSASIVALVSTDKSFTKGVGTYYGSKVQPGVRSTIILKNLTPNTLYYVRLYTRVDPGGHWSANYNSASFWTNRPPSAPILISPAENSTFPSALNVEFTWDPQDPDEGSTRVSELRYRTAALPGGQAGPWITHQVSGVIAAVTFPGGTFRGNTIYEWQVRTQDAFGAWGIWSNAFSFYATAEVTPPLPLGPVNNVAVIVDEDVEFSWRYRDMGDNGTQQRADLRYRPVGQNEWIVIAGDGENPGMNGTWEILRSRFAAGYNYEWQVRTISTGGLTSDWSVSGFFWAINTPGSANSGPPVQVDGLPSGPLGCGQNRVFVYDRGGTVLRGEITPLTSLEWTRKRDDISHALLRVNGWGTDCGDLLSTLRTWQYEIVVFRDGTRVWEGPITRLEYGADYVEIEAKDVMAYVYRRVLRQGFNDAYRIISGKQVGLRTVVERASLITMNCLAYDDPNVLPYLTRFDFEDDARQSRVVPDYSKGAWEEIDDFAATAGLDYATVGRRIMYWDTHRYVGLLPEMSDGDFDKPPVVTEYGMQGANLFAVTNNNGVYGVATRVGADGKPLYYGWLEMIASAYGETSPDAAATSDALTPEARAELEATLSAQADRNIGGRYPVPVIVRVPDTSTLNPECNVDINDLVPGVWIPLRASSTLRPVSQMQKLDSVTVTQTASGETVRVVLSPAPMRGQDFDAEQAAIEE
jgi:hypothetical protein